LICDFKVLKNIYKLSKNITDIEHSASPIAKVMFSEAMKILIKGNKRRMSE
jgi:hypothetical protein